MINKIPANLVKGENISWHLSAQAGVVRSTDAAAGHELLHRMLELPVVDQLQEGDDDVAES